VAKSGKKGSAAKPNKPKATPAPKSPAAPVATGTPVCIAALFCDAAVTGVDKMVTIIRTIDTIVFPQDTQMEIGAPIQLSTPNRLVIMLKRYDAVGRHELPVFQVFTETDKTEPIGLIAQDFAEEDPATGYNFIGPVQFVWRGEGLYWLEIRTKSNTIIARTALRLKMEASGDNK
jgi:hypothetical protein